MDILLSTGSTTMPARLGESAAAQDLASLLPLTLSLSDFHATEKIADLPRRLSTTGSPDAAAARSGDIAYYAPWGNLTVFYRDFPRSPGLVVLGHIDGPIDALSGAVDGSILTITLAGSKVDPARLRSAPYATGHRLPHHDAAALDGHPLPPTVQRSPVHQPLSPSALTRWAEADQR